MLIKWSPFAEMSRVERDMRKLFDFEDFTKTYWRPLVDVRENTKEFVANVEVPGIDPKDIKLTVDRETLTIEGEKKLEKEEKGEYYRTERYYGSFVRSFSLPTSVDSEGISASYDKGVLKITIPKKKEAVPKQIEIK